MTPVIIIFTLVLIIVAVLTKVLGCGIGAKICGYKPYQCKRIGVGMISRGEVALIVASKGAAVGLMGTAFMGPIVVVVIITTIITPILLKIVFKNNPISTVSEHESITGYHEQLADMRQNIHKDKIK